MQTGEGRVVGILADPGHALGVPEAVRAGVPFTVTVTTLGADGCWKAAGADVRVEGALAEVVPYDVHPAGDAGCPDVVVELSREVELLFATPGEAVVRVAGRSFGGGRAAFDRRVVVL